MEIREYMEERRRYFEQNLWGFLPANNSYPKVLRQAMEYSLLAPGKRLRPILAMATAEACGGQLQFALAPATALEMVHTYSLVHDDLPAMDDDDLRRGKPTNHKVFGQGMAILAGDALLTHAFTVLSHAKGLPDDVRLSLVQELAAAAGPQGMVAGQALDIQDLEMAPDLLHQVHACKTGALFKAAVRMGATVGGADAETLDILSAYATSLGMAYQIVDDILDVTATSTDLGKNPGSDTRQHKQTFVTLFGLEEAKAMAAAEIEAALDHLARGRKGFRLLRELALYIAKRQK